MTKTEEKKLRARITQLEQWIIEDSDKNDTCVFPIFKTRCDGCRAGCPEFEVPQRVAA